MKLKIFDKFGTQVFTAEDVLKFNWNGLYNGRLLPSGTYWYVMEIDGHYTRTGWILLKTDKKNQSTIRLFSLMYRIL